MAAITGGPFRFKVQFRIRECGWYESTPDQIHNFYDLCGNTWEWTESERADGVTRFAILRGGSFYQARKGNGSWYMDGGPQEVSFGCKCLLAWPGLDGCATVGFRCAADLEP